LLHLQGISSGKSRKGCIAARLPAAKPALCLAFTAPALAAPQALAAKLQRQRSRPCVRETKRDQDHAVGIPQFCLGRTRH
jgi:hypothetical protein